MGIWDSGGTLGVTWIRIKRISRNLLLWIVINGLIYTVDIYAAGSAIENKPIPVIIAVIDSGVDADNQVLDYSKILQPKSYVEGENCCNDRIGHGTAIIGIIQKHAPKAFIAPLMYCTTYLSGVVRNGGIPAICNAVYDAVDNYKSKVIIITSGITYDDEELKVAMSYAERKGVIAISAVGNDHRTKSDKVFYPAAYDTVIGVGAVDYGMEIADFSQRNESVITVHYGVNLRVPTIRNGTPYTNVSGSSYAAAAVCGIAACVADEYPDITPKEFRKLIKCSCTDLGDTGYDTAYGYGIIDTELLKRNLNK